ncbi:hypothetical protein V6R21_09580 [Limibacter armeniacum]|uniref:hypothetical protein n=1 Tax=Limibacter armeniacum TaxID=466084 RepID=UPI002FE60E3A
MKRRKEKKPKVNEELQGFDIRINASGEIESNYTIDQLNRFLDKHVIDKKLKNREDLDVVRED